MRMYRVNRESGPSMASEVVQEKDLPFAIGKHSFSGVYEVTLTPVERRKEDRRGVQSSMRACRNCGDCCDTGTTVEADDGPFCSILCLSEYDKMQDKMDAPVVMPKYVPTSPPVGHPLGDCYHVPRCSVLERCEEANPYPDHKYVPEVKHGEAKYLCCEDCGGPSICVRPNAHWNPCNDATGRVCLSGGNTKVKFSCPCGQDNCNGK